MRPPRKAPQLALILATALALASMQTFAFGAEHDSTRSDSSTAKSDTVHVLPEVHRVKLPDQGERFAVLSVGLAVLGGFLVLLLFKKGEADRSVGT